MRLVISILTGWLALNIAATALLTVAGILRERRRRHGARVRTVMSHGNNRGVWQ
jgi:hypothetical protein